MRRQMVSCDLETQVCRRPTERPNWQVVDHGNNYSCKPMHTLKREVYEARFFGAPQEPLKPHTALPVGHKCRQCSASV